MVLCVVEGLDLFVVFCFGFVDVVGDWCGVDEAHRGDVWVG